MIIFLSSALIFSSPMQVLADTGNVDISDNQDPISNVKPEDMAENPKKVDLDELFGEEQAFPFIAGLGKNSAK